MSMDEMVLYSHNANLIFFELNSSEFEKIYEKILLEEQEDDKQDDFISALLRLLYINRDKGANVYLDALKSMEYTLAKIVEIDKLNKQS